MHLSQEFGGGVTISEYRELKTNFIAKQFDYQEQVRSSFD